jgi:flagellar export protein FliJ
MPRRFVFPLQPVLEQRERRERDAQLEVASIERERLEVESRLRGLQAGIIGIKHELREQLLGVRSGLDAVRLNAGASIGLVVKAQQAVLELAGVHRRLDAARAMLLSAASDRKAVEMLKVKRLEEWRREQARKEAIEQDELTVMRHARASRSEVV